MLHTGTHHDLADTIAGCVLARYATLPARYNPRVRDDGRPEWTVLAGLVLLKDRGLDDEHDAEHDNHADPVSECVSLATGLKCLPRHKVLEAKGGILHDWHAEILCIRGFNRWLLDECESVINGKESAWLSRRCVQVSGDVRNAASHSKPMANHCPFELRPGVSPYMYVSAAPCGDASMELVMAAQPDATPWSAPAPSARSEDLLGRGHFDQLGVVRRKPSRPDAPSTWSKSCSDKLAAKQCTSLLSSVVAKIVDPSRAYLSGLVLPKDEYVQSALDRSFGRDGRLSPLNDATTPVSWAVGGYAFRPFSFLQTGLAFKHTKVDGAVASNQAILQTSQRSEVLINGVLQGRKQHDLRGASCVSRRGIAQGVLRIESILGNATVQSRAIDQTYSDLKYEQSRLRQQVKDDLRSLALKSWKRNDGDDEWPIHTDS